MQNLHILIVGAGIGGLTAALALQKAGFRVSIYEQAPELGEVGAGVTITPNGCHVLDHLLGDEVMGQICHVPTMGAIKHYKTGETLVNTRRGDRPKRKYGAAYCQTHRADLHGALADMVRELDPEAIHLDSDFVRLDETDVGITATFRNGRVASGDVLIGCDGIRSEVRNALWGKDEVNFTGYIAWRGLVPIDRLEPDQVTPDSAAYAGQGRTFARYRVRQGTLINYVALAKRDAWEAESWSVHSTIAELLEELSDFAPDVQAIVRNTPPEHLYKWGLFDRRPLTQWTRSRATLLGDAAHPLTPFLAQGAVMAIEDGMIVARAFQASKSWGEALARYEAARRERATFVMLESHVNARRMFTRDPETYTEATHKNAETLSLYEYNPLKVPV